jgi:hypothetical protein
MNETYGLPAIRHKFSPLRLTALARDPERKADDD